MFEQAIPPSDGDESDEEMFQHMLVGNNLRKVPDAAYQPPSLNAEYSQLSGEFSSSPGKSTLFTEKNYIQFSWDLPRLIKNNLTFKVT